MRVIPTVGEICKTWCVKYEPLILTFYFLGCFFIYNKNMKSKHLHYLWDYDLSPEEFRDILEGKLTRGRLDQDWAANRLLEYASYEEIIQEIGYRSLVENWARWRKNIRSESRLRGFDFLVAWLPQKHPEMLHD